MASANFVQNLFWQQKLAPRSTAGHQKSNGGFELVKENFLYRLKLLIQLYEVENA